MEGGAENNEQPALDEREFKIVLLGNSGVGKTALINRMVKKAFYEFQPTTVGAMFMSTKVEVDGQVYRLQIWDTAGQERLRAIAPLYYRDANGVILVFDLTSQLSFEALPEWFKDLREKGDERTSSLVVGNKSDLDNYQVSVDQATIYAAKERSQFLPVSAKDGRGVQQAFEEVVRRILRDQNTLPGASKEGSRMNRKTFTEQNEIKAAEGKKKGGCC